MAQVGFWRDIRRQFNRLRQEERDLRERSLHATNSPLADPPWSLDGEKILDGNLSG